MDEQWSFVGNQSQQRWLWYAWSPHFKRIFAYALGSRSDETLKTLLERLKGFNFRLFCTDLGCLCSLITLQQAPDHEAVYSEY